ncbi:EAL domain-containing protein [Sporosarcina thermotolerans]|uniref:EAL domain-containing protein n=1 Tax=Sporosarcina thermotolerans TaxID=633404 RepID=A0AAW9ABF3_9BACL|nr:GGDEF domain-containing phosphodiesterase [Sporosarcina thermotolerans]MDW0118742.1 EAL domain-containing protein [Sporosarcina thermotolerans]WHT48422.1 EAL domain-containing protein [Sporosarcina thermotolerans]
MSSANTTTLNELPQIMDSLIQFLMVTRTDSEGLITYTNNNFLVASDWTPKRILGKSFWQMFSEDKEGQARADVIWDKISCGKSWFGKVEKLSRNGEPYYVKMVAIPMMNDAGILESATFLELDITEDVELQEKLQQIAFIDFETGLMSRHKLEAVANEYINENRHFSFVYITIDHYYTLKDLQSNESESVLIREFTNRLKRYFQGDPIARMGVSQFVVLTGFGDWFVQGFLEFLKEQPIYLDNHSLPLSVSGSIVRYPEDQQSYTQLIKASLAAISNHADQGSSKISSLSADSHKGLNRRFIIDKKMLTALDHNNLQVFYQPQLDIATDKVQVYEALVRWEDEELGSINPDELIPIAEENGLIHAIGAFVIEEAANLAMELMKNDQDISISVNTSVREFGGSSQMKEKLMGILKETKCPPEKIQLEITEKFAFQAEQEQSIIHQMKVLKDTGIQFILDDFGTGYASFRYMQHLPISKVKIDKVFVNSLLTMSKTKQLVEGMILFGKSMGFYVIAEGVETKEQFDLLKEMGVDAVQGYYIGAPMKRDEVF